uniref:RING-type domain-containing protein n=1 Tax=viral metagenome TaxID=1070528 RepID=A0A6C0EJG1_9ZZZZ
MSCPICYEVLEDKDKLTLACNHSFHKCCIKEAVKYNIACPYCREKYTLIGNYSNNNSNVIKYGIIKRRSKTVLFLNSMYTIIRLDKFKENISPNYWINNIYNNSIIPLHTLNINGTDYLMTLYLRLVLIHSADKHQVNIIQKKDILNSLYLDTDDTIYLNTFNRPLSKLSFIICYEWVFDVLHEITQEFNFYYYNFINTLVFDLVLFCLKMTPVTPHEYQTILVSGMYKTIEIILKDIKDLNKEALLNRLIYYSDKACNMESVIKYNNHIDDYIDKYNITKNTIII